MKRMIGLLGLGIGLCVLIALPALAQPEQRGFGSGGAMGMAFFPDMTGLNAFMSENGLDPMGSFLLGAGGNGRGGMIGGLTFGGIGWGLMTYSENEVVSAEFVSAGGGFDLGAAIGGSDDSVLTIGAVIGGGANVLAISGYLVQTIDPAGLVPEPTYREIVFAHGFVQPYVSMAAQLLPWVGFEFRLGYLFPVVGMHVGDLLGIPAPSLELSGPTVSFGFTFGGIGSTAEERAERRAEREAEEALERERNAVMTRESDGSFVVQADGEVVVVNGMGDITVTGYTPTADADLVVEWHATRTAKARYIEELEVILESEDLRATLQSEGMGRVDLTLSVPEGIDVRLKNGLGVVTVTDHSAQTIIVENGLGEMMIENVGAVSLLVTGGIGEIDLRSIAADTLNVDMGLGEITLALPLDASARILTKVGLGDIDVDRFPGMTGGVRGFLGRSGHLTLGQGDQMIELNVGLGAISIEEAR